MYYSKIVQPHGSEVFICSDVPYRICCHYEVQKRAVIVVVTLFCMQTIWRRMAVVSLV